MAEEPHSFDGPLVGERYRLGPLIGEGGQGSTWLALDTERERRVAVKEFSLDKADDWKEFELFQRECRVLHELDHPGIPDYLSEHEADDETSFYLVMEYVPGQTLAEQLADDGVFDEAKLWWVLWRLIDILDHLHVRIPPIVHRDLKPSNLIERPDGRLVLVDFGGVRDFFRSDGGSTVVGTFGYMAPEQLHGQATPATDIYSLGATLVTLGTGIQPEHIERKGLRMRLSKHLRLSKPLMRVLQRLVEPDPDKRPASAEALRELLQREGVTPQDIEDPAPEPEPREPPRDPRSEPDSDHDESADDSDEHAALPVQTLPDDTPRPIRLLFGGAVTLASTGILLLALFAQFLILPLVFGLAEGLGPQNKKKEIEKKHERAEHVAEIAQRQATEALRLGTREVGAAISGRRTRSRAQSRKRRPEPPVEPARGEQREDRAQGRRQRRWRRRRRGEREAEVIDAEFEVIDE